MKEAGMAEKGLIDRERPEDVKMAERVVREAFWNVYRPGCVEHYLLHRLRPHADFVPELNLVMRLAGQLVGQACCVRSQLHTDDGRVLPVLHVGPIAIVPEKQGQGLGSQLLQALIARAETWGARALFLEGAIGFYGKCGFEPASRYGIRYQGLPEGQIPPSFCAGSWRRIF